MVKITLVIVDVVVIECNGAGEVGSRALRGRPQKAVPRCSTRKRSPPGLHEGAPPRCLISLPGNAC